jgi:hypothetical protein
LANEHNSFDVALSIAKAAAEAFKLLPRAMEQLREDLALLEMWSAEASAVPLQKWIEELYGNDFILVNDLEHHGFGEGSVREAKELWNHFAVAAKKTQHTKAADRPWLMVRCPALAINSLALPTNNEENSPQAAKALLDGMLRLARSIPPPEKILDMIHQDVRSIERNIREKKLAKDIEANRVSAALAKIDELLKSQPSPDERETLNALRHKLEGLRGIEWVDLRA